MLERGTAQPDVVRVRARQERPASSDAGHGRPYEAPLSVAKPASRSVRRGIRLRYGLGNEGRCPYRGKVGKGEGGFGHR